MTGKAGNISLFLSKAMLLFAVLGAFFSGQTLFYEQTLFFFWGNYIVLLVYAVNLLLVSRVFNGFNFGSSELYEIILSWILCLVVTNGLAYLLLSLLEYRLLNFIGFLLITLFQLILVFPMAIIINYIYYRLHPAQKAIVIYGSEHVAKEYCAIISKHRKRFVVHYALSQDTHLNELIDRIKESDTVFFLDVDITNKETLLEHCFRHGKRTYILPTFSGVLLNTADISWISNSPLFLSNSSAIDPVPLFIKRCIDIFISVIMIALLSWLMLIVYVIIWLYDRQPAMYKQRRVTKGGKEFMLYKFRSMKPDAEADGVARLSVQGDDRVTPVGKFIRKTRIDELPQLFNVLSGAMSLVGPRPERPEIAKQYEAKYPNFSLRTKVKAGITGYAQIYGKYNTAPDEKLFLDIMYIEKFSIWQDIKLIMQTLKVLFISSSTEGVAEDLETALRKR